MKQFAEEVGRLCREYWDCCAEAGRMEECREVRRKLELFCRSVQGRLDISEPEMLLALMDAYEVIRDEELLQDVLDVVGGNLDSLEVSAVSVKLLAYCYYYVEEEDCKKRAREMLEELKRRGEDVIETEKVLDELV